MVICGIETSKDGLKGKLEVMEEIQKDTVHDTIFMLSIHKDIFGTS